MYTAALYKRNTFIITLYILRFYKDYSTNNYTPIFDNTYDATYLDSNLSVYNGGRYM